VSQRVKVRWFLVI